MSAGAAARARSGLDALILAAGSGARMGGPKARLIVDGEALALRHVRRAREAGCSRVLVVARPEELAWLEAAGVEAVASSAPDQAGSLAVGVRALGTGSALVLITPVDALPVAVETIALLRSRLATGVDAVSPQHGGAGGHPVLVRASVLEAYRSGAAPPLRDVLSALGGRRVRVPVEDARAVVDLDTPAEVVRVTGAPPRFA